jgi:DMSO reductase anchor subunit
MRPAWSVVLLTTLLGAGQGLFLAVFMTELLWSVPASFVISATAASLALCAAGLAASFFHLGRPERAWRSAARWRTSWLSREAIALPAFIALVAAHGAMHLLGLSQAAVLAGVLAAVACVALFICTGMIYACLKFLQEWHSPLTVVNFILLGTASGLTGAAAIASASGSSFERTCAFFAFAATLLAAAMRGAALVRNARLRLRSSLQTAIGVKHPEIAQKAQGAMGGSFNTREFFHGTTAARLAAVKWGFLAGAFGIPAALLLLQFSSIAFFIQLAGLAAERWYFFAEARHPQNLYYQAIS